MAKGWDKSPGKLYLRMAQDSTSKQARATALQAFDLITMRSPVLNGIYRGNHIISINIPDASFRPEKKDTTDAETELTNLPPYPLIYLQNNSPYASVIEYGTESRPAVLVYTSAFQAISDSE